MLRIFIYEILTRFALGIPPSVAAVASPAPPDKRTIPYMAIVESLACDWWKPFVECEAGRRENTLLP